MDTPLEKTPTSSISKESRIDLKNEIPRKDEGGLFDLHDDAEMMAGAPAQEKILDNKSTNPKNWTFGKKFPIAMFAIAAVYNASFAIPMQIGAEPGTIIDYGVTATEGILPTSVYSWGIGFGVLLGTATSELFGRQIVYRVSLPLTLIFTIVAATSKNYAALVVGKALAGVAVGPCLAIGVGVLNDIWDLATEQIGTAFVFLLGMVVIFASQTGPMASQSIVTYHEWHWTIWITVIMTGILLLASILLPETYAPAIARREAKKSGQALPPRPLASLVAISLFRPLHMLVVEPIVFPSALVLSVSQSIIFSYYVAYTLLFRDVYNFTNYQCGLAFAPLLVGSVVAMPIVVVVDKLTYRKAVAIAQQTGGTVAPEKRLYPVMLSAILLPISLFWLAWSGRASVHWAVPVMSGFLSGIAYVLNMICLTVYNNEIYARHYGASVMAGTTFCRFLVSAAFPLFTKQMVEKLGFDWAVSLLAFVTVAMIPIPWAFYKWGPQLRAGSKYLKN